MKAMQKFIHLSLTVAILLAAMGFRVNVPHCSEEQSSLISLFSAPSCCCGKTEKASAKACNEMACVFQQSAATQNNFSSSTQQLAKFVKEPANYPIFTQTIRPVILARLPHFTLPPPISGRFLGILHQTFII